MQALGLDEGVFIRSMATRGNLGGLARATVDAVAILDAAGYAKIIVETVGVGQDEVEIVKAADVSVVVLVPGMGDDIQAIKAGIMEIGDIFVINKADSEGVYATEKELESLLSLASRDDDWDPPIVKTVATENQGVADLARRSTVFPDTTGATRQQRATRLSPAGGLSNCCGKACSPAFWQLMRRLLCLIGSLTKLQPGGETLILRWRNCCRRAVSRA